MKLLAIRISKVGKGHCEFFAVTFLAEIVSAWRSLSLSVTNSLKISQLNYFLIRPCYTLGIKI